MDQGFHVPEHRKLPDGRESREDFPETMQRRMFLLVHDLKVVYTLLLIGFQSAEVAFIDSVRVLSEDIWNSPGPLISADMPGSINPIERVLSTLLKFLLTNHLHDLLALATGEPEDCLQEFRG